jgi:acyl carrier protein
VNTSDQIRRVIGEHAKLSVDCETVDSQADLFQMGMTSHASVNVMLALEEEFDVEFPDRMLRKSTFESISAIESAITELVGVVGG